MPANAPAHPGGWIQFGGLPFAIATTQMNPYLLIVPQWATGLYLAAGLFALAGWNTPAGRRIAATVCLFVILFAVVGRPFNYYWGLLTARYLFGGGSSWALLIVGAWPYGAIDPA